MSTGFTSSLAPSLPVVKKGVYAPQGCSRDCRAQVNFRGPTLRYGSAKTVAVVHLLESAERALSENKEGARICIAKATALLTAAPDSPTPRRGCLAPWQLRLATNFIEANISGRIALRRLAEIAGLNASQFSHAFRASMGQSPHAFVRRRRIARAQELMLMTNKSLSEIALDSGLADQSHLNRASRQIVGLSPGGWRRSRGAPRKPLSGRLAAGRAIDYFARTSEDASNPV
jgi:AraC family transcriptional regulator